MKKDTQTRSYAQNLHMPKAVHMMSSVSNPGYVSIIPMVVTRVVGYSPPLL